MAKQVKCGDFLVIEVCESELRERIGGLGICDNCGEHSDNGFLIPVLNKWFCPACYEDWKAVREYYIEDAEYEHDRFNEYLSRLDVELLPDPEQPNMYLVSQVYRGIAKEYSLPLGTILAKNRIQDVSEARHILVYLLHYKCGMSLSRIARVLRRTHPTIINSLNVVEGRIKVDRPFRAMVEKLRAKSY